MRESDCRSVAGPFCSWNGWASGGVEDEAPDGGRRPEERIQEVRIARDEAEANQLASAGAVPSARSPGVSPTTILEDATVPRVELARMVRFVEQVAARYRLRVGTFGRMGMAICIRPSLTDERNHEEMEPADAAFREILRRRCAWGGPLPASTSSGSPRRSFCRVSW